MLVLGLTNTMLVTLNDVTSTVSSNNSSNIPVSALKLKPVRTGLVVSLVHWTTHNESLDDIGFSGLPNASTAVSSVTDRKVLEGDTANVMYSLTVFKSSIDNVMVTCGG